MVFRILRPDSDSVWENDEILKRFPRYKGIIDGNQVARYLVAKKVILFIQPITSTKLLKKSKMKVILILD